MSRLLLRFGGVAWLLGLLLMHAEPATVLAGVVAVVAAAVVLQLVTRVPATGDVTLTGPVLRAHSADTATHPQRDPDAAGRPRPRAPSASPLTA